MLKVLPETKSIKIRHESVVAILKDSLDAKGEESCLLRQDAVLLGYGTKTLLIVEDCESDEKGLRALLDMFYHALGVYNEEIVVYSVQNFAGLPAAIHEIDEMFESAQNELRGVRRGGKLWANGRELK